MKTVEIRLKGRSQRYTIGIGSGLLNSAEGLLPFVGGKIAIVSNKRVFGLYGERLTASLKRSGAATAVHLIGDGERFKNWKTLEQTLGFLAASGIGRSDTVIALGGGVVGDLAGFASAVHMRGVRFVQIPTTLLSMIDSSVGGKTSVNTRDGKNLVGAFHQPEAVIIDTDVLATLPRREITAGFCEAIKHGILAGRHLFDLTSASIGPGDRSHAIESGERLDRFLADQIRFKAAVVRGDEFEDPNNSGPSSRKILNFGHTFGHSLEKATNYRVFRHGEAVGYGILFAAELSKKLELLNNNTLELLYDVVHRAGILPPLGNISAEEIFDAFRFDKKIVGEQLQWILLRDIGKPTIVPQAEIPNRALQSVLKRFLRSN